jgi:hypothetical protein
MTGLQNPATPMGTLCSSEGALLLQPTIVGVGNHSPYSSGQARLRVIRLLLENSIASASISTAS